MVEDGQYFRSTDSNAAINRNGDYYTVRQHFPNSKLFSAFGYGIRLVDPTRSTNCNILPGCRFDPRYVLFGRASDIPVGIDLVPVRHLCHTPSAFQLLVTIGNQGDTDAPVSITKIEFRGPPTPVLLSTPPIAAGATVELPPINWGPECAVTPSGEQCDFIVTADSENQLNESNEGNNSADVRCSFIR